MRRRVTGAVILGLASQHAPILAGHALAQTQPDPVPHQAPFPPPMPPIATGAYPGTIRLHVDATDLDRRVMTVHETIPVSHPGDLVLLFPQWLPGDHGPDGRLSPFAGLVIHAAGGTGAGQRLAWRRDPVDMFAFHVDIPQGATAIDVDDQSLTPTESDEGRVVMTPRMVNLEWNTVLLYPAGYDIARIAVAPSITLPQGWHAATALDPAATGSTGTGGTGTGTSTAQFAYRTVGVDTLVDSPLIAGSNFARFDLAPGASVPVHLNVVADTPQELAATEAQLRPHRALIEEEQALFHAHHYDHYDFLLMLSDQLDGQGLEHHRSSEDAVGGGYFSQWDKTFGERDLLSHEYTHSWNGKFRRPADLYSPNFDIPERDSLLWVYEGLTEYWGQVLAARSGLWSHQDALEALAADAASEQDAVGRSWRTLADTTDDPIFKQRRPISWRNWQREEDYYVEGLLIWLDADTLIRTQTHGAKSLDDFARSFFGMNDGSWGVSTYDFDDVVRALNAVTPYDWAGFLHARLDTNPASAPLDGLARGGYRLAYDDKPNTLAASLADTEQRHGFEDSIGIGLSDATISDVAWGSPAWHAGLVVGDKILGINGMTWNAVDDLGTAIHDAHLDHKPISLLVASGRTWRVVQLAYDGGLRYPHLVRVSGTPGLIDDILKPHRPDPSR